MPPSPLSILFAGKLVRAKLVDGTDVAVFVRALPQRYLGEVLAACENPSALVELCCYVKSSEQPSGLTPDASRLSPPIPPPAGMDAVPAGFADNLTDESLSALHELAQSLNFSRAAKWAEGQIAVKKQVAPLHAAAMAQVLPMLEKIVAPLLARLAPSSTSTPSSPPSPAAPASSS